MLGEDVLYLSATELGQRLHKKELSPVELTRAYLDRTAALDPKLHAYVTLTPELALKEAKQAEAEIVAGKLRGPLHGVPYAAKDLLATRGIPTTWGAKPFAGRVIDEDATVILKLRAAGAVLLGKLAMIELAGGLGYVVPGASLTGAARNPWNTDHWTCGSSSGSGAAVAAGLVGFAIGTETWGSIVCPSSFCGISGIRPTFGRVSRHGAMALAWTFDKIGPMARSADDCDDVLRVLSGHDPKDDWSAEVVPPQRLAAPGALKLRVGFVRLDFSKAPEKDVEEVFLKALADLRGAGVKAEEVQLPELPFEETAGLMIGAEAGAAFEELFKDGRVRQLADKGAPLALAAGQTVTGSDYVKAARIRTVCQRAMAEFFSKWDVLLAPSEMMTAFPADQSFENVAWSDPVGGMGNLCGLPGASVPCGFGKSGLPVGLGIVGGAFEEHKVLALAKLYQQVTDWHRRRPPIQA